MAKEEADSLLSRLRTGKKVLCEKCGKGYYIPYNTTADKAHGFYCSEKNCNNFINIDVAIDIE